MGKMKVKREDFRLYQCSKKEKSLIHPKDKKNETGSAYGKKEFNLLDDDVLNDVGKLMNLAIFFHLGMMKI